MPSPTDFNLSPYYDDFTESKKFHRILFRPSFAVQARELTQSQTILQNQIERVSDHLFKQGAMVIDVRTPEEFKKGNLRGSVNIPLLSIRDGFDKLSKDKSYVLCCRRGIQSEVAAFLMRQKGFDVSVLKGGLATIASKPKA